MLWAKRRKSSIFKGNTAYSSSSKSPLLNLVKHRFRHPFVSRRLEDVCVFPMALSCKDKAQPSFQCLASKLPTIGTAVTSR